MSTLRLSHVKKIQREMNIPLRLKIAARKKEESLRGLSIALGMNKNFLNQHGKKHDYTAAELMALSIYLDSNLFEWYSERLPEHIRSTKREAQLLNQLDEMEKQLIDVIRERDWLKEVVGRR